MNFGSNLQFIELEIEKNKQKKIFYATAKFNEILYCGGFGNAIIRGNLRRKEVYFTVVNSTGTTRFKFNCF